MADIQQCFRCGEFGHLQLACPNEGNAEARKILNEISRENRATSKNDEYRKKWDLRREALNNFNGDMTLLNRFVNGLLDLLYEMQDEMDDVDLNNLDELRRSAEKLRKLKLKLEGKLTEIREVVYVAKYYKGKHANVDEREIFEARAYQLDHLRNHVWNQLWKTEKRTFYALKLISNIRREGAQFSMSLEAFRVCTGTQDEQSMLLMFSRMKNHEADLMKDMDNLFSFVKDNRIPAELDAYGMFLIKIRDFLGDPRDKRDKAAFREAYDQFRRRTSQF